MINNMMMIDDVMNWLIMSWLRMIYVIIIMRWHLHMGIWWMFIGWH